MVLRAASTTDRSVVPEVVAACLGVGPQPGESLTTSVLGFLRNKRLLLVLDNCEHVIASVGSLAEAIAHACQRVAILATSREALGVDGEVLRPIGPLDVPAEGLTAAEVVRAASVQLFADRAARSVRTSCSTRRTVGGRHLSATRRCSTGDRARGRHA